MQSQTGVQSVMPHLHSNFDAFQKYSELCAGSTGRWYTTTLKGIASDVERNFLDFEKRKVRTCDDYDLRARNVTATCPVSFSQTLPAKLATHSLWTLTVETRCLFSLKIHFTLVLRFQASVKERVRIPFSANYNNLSLNCNDMICTFKSLDLFIKSESDPISKSYLNQLNHKRSFLSVFH
ncbi:hypothetical protein Tco_0845949 [Tanacetum coccineum]